MATSQTPNRGDFLSVNFTPQAGREQGGFRRALVLSPYTYHQKTGLAIVCPITGSQKGYPFEVEIPDGLAVYGVVLTDHVKSIDLSARGAKIEGQAPDDLVKKCSRYVKKLLPEDT